ncbi:MAG: hypothetical protein V3V82_00460 [Acidimicrobiia bacterium]
MQPNPDPKPGRWLLPVVILAMMGGAWLFLSAAEDPTPSPTTTTLDAGSTDTTAPASATTTTTLPSVLAEYNRQLGFRVTEADELLARAQGINSDFDNKATTGFQYSAAVTALQTLADDVQTFRNSIGFLEVPEADVPGIDPVHKEMRAVAQEMVDQANAMVAGLKSPDTGEARKAALDAFETAVVDYRAKVDELMAFEPA